MKLLSVTVDLSRQANSIGMKRVLCFMWMWTQYLLYLHVGFTAITFSVIKFDDSDLKNVDINTYNTATATNQKKKT